ncbi:ligand-binding sensor domain-containing protein [Rhizobium tubonense]|uniref:Histidine kinase/HSP90-like ATPase domain-containing protein n=1 Tax=Rhizobium tubonense TaxID=484088 RepID=A0A2W4C2K7_9HYPH|nr:sensor histidine kinase [Rhizobium tubonense]PZM08049.1 hypothetical protein CPY51_30345 [Rhizobium tubonense]
MINQQSNEVLVDRQFACALSALIVLVFSLVGMSDVWAASDRPTVVEAIVEPAFQRVHVEDRADIRFRKLSLSQGLSQTRVSQIVQDDDGFLWFGTQHGVNRYDGYGFKVFKHEPGEPGSLSGVFIWALFKDHSGTIWVGSDQFLDAFDKSTSTFKHYSFDPSNPTVIHISEDRIGNLWLSTSQGLFRLDPKTGVSTRFVHDESDPTSLASSDVKSTGEDAEGTFWVADSAGLEAFDRDTGRVTVRIPLRQEVREFSFHEDKHGIFWIIYGSGNGLATYDRKTNKVVRYSFEDDVSDGSLTGVYSMLETAGGDIWLATMGGGLLRFDRDEFKFIRYTHDPNDPQSLAENRVITLFEDAEGNIWTGLHASPPNTFPREAPPFKKLWPFPGHVDKLGESLVNAIFEDSTGAVWLGAGGALNRLDPAGQSISVLTPAGPGSTLEVLSIAEDKAGTIWIGTLGRGLFAYDPHTHSFKSYRYDANRKDGLSSDIVSRIHFDNFGKIWLSTWNGIVRFDPATEHFETFKRDPNASAELYFSIVVDADGIYWLGTTNGLVRFDPETHGFREFKHNPVDPTSLSNNTINSIYVGERGLLWIGTQNGLNRFHTETGKSDKFFDTAGLAGNAVSCLVSDGDGVLWMSTNRGVSKLNIDDLTFDNYSTANGLPGDDLTGWNACASGKNGAVYFGGFGGGTVNRHTEHGHETYVPPLVFTDIQLANGTDGALLDPSLSRPSVRLPFDKSNIAVSFSALSYRSPETTRYRYKLVGFDMDWHAVTSQQRSISYAALPAGDFSLRVQAATTRGVWNMPGAVLALTVMPPWWTTWWFRTISAGAIISLLAAIYRYQVSKVAAHYRVRLEERINERNRLARDLHDTLLQSFQGLTIRLQAARHLLPAKAAEAATMLDIVLQKSDDAIIEGRNAVQALRESTRDDIAEAVRKVGIELAHTPLAAAFDLKIDGQVYPLDPSVNEQIYRIVSEAIRNAFKHSGAKLIECEFRYLKDELRVVVRDDGSGIRSNTDRKKPLGGGWGIAGMKERAENIGAHLMIQSAGDGTTVELILKVAAHRGRGLKI